jgi:hypothetical protein
MQSVGGGTDGGVFRGRMEAQSIRAKPSIENYQYVSSHQDGRTKLSFVGEFGWDGNEPFMGWNFIGCAYEGKCRYTSDLYEKNLVRAKQNDFDWNYPDIMTAFKSNSEFYVQHQNTNYIIYNRGLWGVPQEDKAKTMMSAIQNMTGGVDAILNRCFYKSTTGCYRSKDIDSIEYGHVRSSAYNYGCEYFDIAHVTEEFSRLVFNPKPPPMLVNEFKHVFWDSLHYVSKFIICLFKIPTQMSNTAIWF